VIDLRSDTVTQPTAGMRAAIAGAVVGDEQKREDPTVLELERRAAELLGQEEAVYLPTATMANQIAVRILSEPGDELLAHEHAHVFVAEQGGAAAHSGLVTRPLTGETGTFTAEQVRAAYRPAGTHTSRTRVVAVENTHNMAGGRMWPLAEVDAVAVAARELDLRLHLDGARLMNAAVASGVAASEYGRRFDTVTLCLSKGLGCPVGALLATSEELAWKARRGKHLFGGAMRQAGIIAAAGIYALDHHVERLADDHERARRLGEGLRDAGIAAESETNFVQIDLAPLDLAPRDAVERLRDEGVLVTPTVHPTKLRALTHLDVDDDDVERAIELIPRALGVPLRV
jgi:threonine aldolase